MGKCNNNSISDVSIIKTTQYPTTQKVTQEKLRAENVNFEYSFRPIYYISRFFGLMPFSIVFDPIRGIQKPHVNIFDGIWFFVSILIYISMAFISYNDIKLSKDSNTASFILMLGDSVLLILGLIYSALIIIFDMRNRFKLIEILNKFIKFDKEVGSHFDFNSIGFVYFRSKYFFRYHAMESITIIRRKIDVHGYFASYQLQ